MGRRQRARGRVDTITSSPQHGKVGERDVAASRRRRRRDDWRDGRRVAPGTRSSGRPERHRAGVVVAAVGAMRRTGVGGVMGDLNACVGEAVGDTTTRSLLQLLAVPDLARCSNSRRRAGGGKAGGMHLRRKSAGPCYSRHAVQCDGDAGKVCRMVLALVCGDQRETHWL